MIVVRKPTQAEIQQAEEWPIWEKEPSEFPWRYDEDETCLILEGIAEIVTEDKKVIIKSGDYVIFPKGLQCDWHIKERIKKHYKFG